MKERDLINNRGNTVVITLGAVPILIVLFFVLCFRTVNAGKVGVVTRFGDIDRQVNSGVVIKLPWPIERLNKLDIKIQKKEQDAASATLDLQDVNAKLAVNYALNAEKAGDVFRTLGGDYEERIINPAVQESFKAASAQYTAAELLTKRPEVKEKIVDVIKKRVEPYGVRIEDVSIVNFTFSAEFTKALEAKQVAAQQAEQEKYNIEKARNAAQAQIESARGQAESLNIINASLNPQILQRNAIEKWSGNLPQYVVLGDNDSGFFGIPFNAGTQR